MSFATTATLILTIGLQLVGGIQEDYYWREYVGIIPSDAVIAGKDISGKNIYIGQAPILSRGSIPTGIYSGVKEVYPELLGIHKVERFVKILCGPQENFYWLSANGSHLHITLTDKHAVIAGYSFQGGYYNVGRIAFQGETKIGKVNAFFVGAANLYFNNSGATGSASNYEVLIYSGTGRDDHCIDYAIDSRIRPAN